MRAMTPDWVLTALWFVAGVGATGVFWYYLSQKAPHSALWTGFLTGVVVLLTICLNIRNNLIKEEQRAVESAAPTAPERRPQVFLKQSAFVGRLGDNANMAVDLLLSNSGCVGSSTSGQKARRKMRDFELLRLPRRRSEADEQTRVSTVYS
jgi:hypothetical protein